MQHDRPEKSEFFLKCWMNNSDTVRAATSWMISTHGHELQLQEIIDLYQVRFQTLVDHAEDIFTGNDERLFQSRLQELVAGGVSLHIARRLALFPEIVRILEMLWASKMSHHSIPVVAQVYGSVLDHLNLTDVLHLESRIDTANKWESELLSHSYDEIRHRISRLSVVLLERNMTTSAQIVNVIKAASGYEQLVATISEIEDTIPPVTAIAVIARQLAGFSLKS